MNRSTKITA